MLGDAWAGQCRLSNTKEKAATPLGAAARWRRPYPAGRRRGRAVGEVPDGGRAGRGRTDVPAAAPVLTCLPAKHLPPLRLQHLLPNAIKYAHRFHAATHHMLLLRPGGSASRRASLPGRLARIACMCSGVRGMGTRLRTRRPSAAFSCRISVALLRLRADAAVDGTHLCLLACGGALRLLLLPTLPARFDIRPPALLLNARRRHISPDSAKEKGVTAALYGFELAHCCGRRRCCGWAVRCAGGRARQQVPILANTFI